MLTTALNFLTDKRKRFHRSDTMPAFTNDSNFFKLTSDNQIIEIDKHSNVNKGINDHDNDDDNINTTNTSNTNNDGITFTNIHKRGTDHYEGETLPDKSISYRDDLPSSSSRSCTHEKLFENNDANDADDDDEGGGGGDDDNECNTSLVNFPSFTLNDKNSIESIKISCKEHLSVGNLDKYQFLDLETNLYRHGKNHLNSSINENIPRRLSHGYSLSNVQVPLDNTSIKSDVCSSVTFSRKAFNDIHHNFKDRKINDSSKCRKFESTKSLRFPTELKDSFTFISGDSNTEQTIDSTMKVSNKSKVAKMRARAVARVTKNKLKRSKSSAYMSKHFQELNSEDNNNNNNNIRNRSSSTHRNSDIHYKEQHLTDNKIHSNLMKNWIDKTPRIRSDISPQNITNTTNNNTNNSNIYEITNMNEYFEELVNKANTYKFQIINAQDYSNPINNITKTTNDTNDNDNNNNDNITMTTDNYIAKMLFSRNYNSTLHNNNTTYNKLNRYSVVKKLRRNNSSITYSNDQLTLLSNNNDHTMITTNSTAGDLLLPLTNNNNNNNDVMKNLIDQFFLMIKYNNYNQFFKLYNQYKKLSNKQLKQIHIATNQFGFTLLDCTQFNSSLLLYSYLLICEFLPGPYFQSILYCHPKYYSLYKFNKINQYLENLLDEKEIQLNKCKLDTNNTITLMNQLNIIDNNQNKYNNTNNNTNNNNNTNISNNNSIINNNNNEQLNNTKIFAEISSKEKQLQLLIDEYDYLMKLIYNYNKLPNYTKSPHKVNIFLYSSNSILIRISPPKINKFNNNNNHNKNDDYNDDDNDHDHELDHSSYDTTDNELNQDFLNEGRKMNDINHISNDNLILRYCIEWSTCPKFSNTNELYHCIVIPPIRMIKPNLNKIKQNQLNILRVGFYYLNNLPENKMIFIRVYAFSIKGWSEPCYSNPNGIILSSWIHNKLCEQYQTIIQHDNLHLSYTKYVDCSLNKQIDILKNDLFKQLSTWTNNLSIHSNTTYNNNNPINMIDETNKRTRSPLLQRKRSFRFPFSNKGLKFVKQTKSGVYLALIYHTPIHPMTSTTNDKLNYKSKILLTDDYIPIINISRDDYTNESIINSDFNWFSRLVSDSLIDIDLQLLYDNHITNTSLPTNLQLRVRLLEIIQRLKLLFNLSNLGIVYPEIIRTQLIDPNLINLKLIKNETFDLQDQISTLKLSIETNDSINSNTNYDNHLKLTSTYLFILLKQINNPNDIILTNNLKWCNFDKFLKQNKIKLKNNFFQFNSNTEFINYSSIMINMTKNLLLPTIYSHLLTTRDNQIYILPESQLIINLDILLNYSIKHNNLLKPGLYIVLLQMKANIDQQATILISNTLSIIHMLPCEKIRTRSHVSYNEWYSLCKLINKTNEKLENNFFNLNYNEKYFIIKFIKAIMKLSNRLCYPINHLKMFRIFLPEIIKISPVHSFIILLPPIDQVCLPPTSIILPSSLTPPNCSWISMTYFERNLGINYDSLFYNPIHYLISLLELLIPLSQFIQRQCLNELDLIQITERTQSLQMIQTNLENLYQSKRWLSDTISIGRDRKKMYNFHITIEQIINEYNEILKPYLIKSNNETLTNETINFNVLLHNNESTGLNNEKTVKPRSSSVHSELFDIVAVSKRIDRSTLPCSPTEPKHIGKNSVIHVYTDYPTGLNPGVSVRLLINIRTTVGEVIDTVVKQLLETADRKIFTTAENNDSPTALCSFDFTRNNVKHNLENHLFCLTVSVGQLERCLPNTVRLALLRRPWKFGKLTVRFLNDLPENIRHQITLNPVESKHSGLSNQIVSPLLTVTLVEPNLKQANINSPPKILH
ncbi:unnamed protein product [Schistosoma rodhaini]|uniref:Ras-associating domain-containing protein n=1 Tax=Schistosoma rodhaini TaxID=6188 RepID=A0AA85FWW4_9TREM|nr:unnamed protein product [Schistosoma rodhaini]CAH8570369.1 unnamed protein product [Schistosoma rodhaini]